MSSLEFFKNFDYYSASVLLRFGATAIAGTVLAMLLALFFGRKSFVIRQAIFGMANFGSLCASAYFAFPH